MKNKIQTLNSALLVLVFTFAIPLQAQAIDYYVDQNHPSANDQNTGTIERPWKTVTKANQTLTAGDTVYIKAGIYTSYIAPKYSGTSSNRITYRNYRTDVVTVQNAPYGIYLDGKDYITVQGINFYNLDKFLWLKNDADYNIIAYCNFDHGRNMGWSGSKIYAGSSHNWIHHSQFSRYGYYTDDDIGSVIDIGTEENTSDQTQYNLIEDSIFYFGGHHVFGLHGRWNVVRNNHMYNPEWSMDGDPVYGNRVLYITGAISTWGENLIEGNRIGYSGDPPDGDGATNFLLAGNYNIVRKNDIFRAATVGISLSCGSSYPVAPSYNHIYNNNIFDNGQGEWGGKDECGIYFHDYGHPDTIEGNVLKNNILYSNGSPSTCSYGFSGVSEGDQTFAGNWEEAGDPKFVDTSGTDPMSSTNPDFTLQSDSSSIDSGVYLTTITSSSGSGTTFAVDDARYFTDGFTIVNGDEIQLSGNLQKARITNINYTTNTITVDRSLTWTQNQGISLAYEGAAPDIGAHEYGAHDALAPSPPKNLRIIE